MKDKIIGFLITAFIIIAIAFIGLHHNDRKFYPKEVALIPSDVEYLTMVLKKRNAADCIIESTTYGWKCTEKSGKVYKIKKNSGPWRDASLSNSRRNSNQEMAENIEFE